jgi:hypothetical protein
MQKDIIADPRVPDERHRRREAHTIHLDNGFLAVNCDDFCWNCQTHVLIFDLRLPIFD